MRVKINRAKKELKMKEKKSKKLTLKKITIQSFVTKLDDGEIDALKGGNFSTGVGQCFSPMPIVCRDIDY